VERVTVIGAGIAGLVAAITAAEEGCDVLLLEKRAGLGGRARTTRGAYRANLGPHALYRDGALWKWLEERQMLPAVVGRGREPFLFVEDGRATTSPPVLRSAIRTILESPAPSGLSFSDWAAPRVGLREADLLAAFAFITTFEWEAGRLSAAFVQERIRRQTGRDVVRYVVGGWAALIDQLRVRAVHLGVVVEARHKVSRLPSTPVVVATDSAAAARLLGCPSLRLAGTRVGLLDLALTETALPTAVLDLKQRFYLARYTAFDRSLAPPGEELIQIVCGCQPGESFGATHERAERVLDTLDAGWRQHSCWRRPSLLSGATGAIDLPGKTVGDRPPIQFAAAVFCAGDYVAAPGLLAEVSHASGVMAGLAAAEMASSRRGHRACRTPRSRR